MSFPSLLCLNHNYAPLMTLCTNAEDDFTFPLPARRRAEDILISQKRTYHIQVFSGVKHGFAVRADLRFENERKLWVWSYEKRGIGCRSRIVALAYLVTRLCI